ncbi:MAG: hypothetical protein ACKVPJ_05095 [Chitinophagales bacterium]
MQKIFCSVALLLTLASGECQIIFQNYDPDFTSSGTQPTLSIDFNKDDSTDFEIKKDTSISVDAFGIHTDLSVMIRSVNELYVLSNDVFAIALEENILVDANAVWPLVPGEVYFFESNYLYISFEGDTIYHHNSFTWPDSVGFYYIAFKQYVAGNPYYGWVKLKLNTNALTFIVDSYAYNASPREGLHTGQTNPALESVQFEIVKENIVFLVPPGLDNEHISFRLFDMLGNKIMYMNDIQNQNSLPLYNIPGGAYIGQLLINGSITSSQKIVIFQ